MMMDKYSCTENLKNLAVIVNTASALFPVPTKNTIKPANLKPNKLQTPIVASVRPPSLQLHTWANLHPTATGLLAVSIRQALFIAPCSFHLKCIRPLIESHHPAFSCPLCRTYSNLRRRDERRLYIQRCPYHSLCTRSAHTCNGWWKRRRRQQRLYIQRCPYHSLCTRSARTCNGWWKRRRRQQ